MATVNESANDICSFVHDESVKVAPTATPHSHTHDHDAGPHSHSHDHDAGPFTLAEHGHTHEHLEHPGQSESSALWQIFAYLRSWPTSVLDKDSNGCYILCYDVMPTLFHSGLSVPCPVPLMCQAFMPAFPPG